MEQCKLCLRKVSQLEGSHFLSAGIYRILRDETEKNLNPWLLTPTTAVQTSRQMKARLLCRDCEQRFSELGEAWVLRHCLRKDGSFPLASILAARAPDVASSKTTTRIYYAAAVPEIKIAALAYFGASIFWRGSIYPWNEDGSTPVRLGPFQEQFRQYLLGQQPFPKDCCLLVSVRERNGIDRVTYAPIGDRKDKIHVYKFPIPGLAFSMAVSKNIPANFRAQCIVYGPGNPITVTSVIDKFILDDAVRMRQQGTA